MLESLLENKRCSDGAVTVINANHSLVKYSRALSRHFILVANVYLLPPQHPPSFPSLFFVLISIVSITCLLISPLLFQITITLANSENVYLSAALTPQKQPEAREIDLGKAILRLGSFGAINKKCLRFAKRKLDRR